MFVFVFGLLVPKIQNMNPEILQPTTFPLDPNDPLASPHRIIHDFLARVPSAAIVGVFSMETDWNSIRASHQKAAADVLQLPLETQLGCIKASARFSDWSRFEWGWSTYDKAEETHFQMGCEGALDNLCHLILEQPREWNEDELRELIEIPVPYSFEKWRVVTGIFENHLANHAVSGELKPAIERVRQQNASVYNVSHWLQLGAALGDELVLQSGEKWADDARRFMLALPEKQQIAWREFLLFCFDSDKSKPSAKWVGTAREGIERIGAGDIERECARWFASWGDTPLEINEAVLKGVVWSASLLEGSDIARALGILALSASELGEVKHTSHRTRSASLFNAGVWSLGQRPDGLPVLLELRGKIAQKSLRNSLEKAIVAAQNQM